MDFQNEKTVPFNYINGLVAAFLDEIAGRPVPSETKRRLADIREAVAKGIATIDMGLNIIELFPSGPDCGTGRGTAA